MMYKTMVKKASGELQEFSQDKLRGSLERSGTDPMLADEIADHMRFRGDRNREGWLVTNTRFTDDALAYGSCIGLKRAVSILSAGTLAKTTVEASELCKHPAYAK